MRTNLDGQTIIIIISYTVHKKKLDSCRNSVADDSD